MTGQALCIHLLQSDAGHALGVYFPMAGHDLSWNCKGAPQRQPQQQGCDEPLSVVVYGLWCSISCSCSWESHELVPYFASHLWSCFDH